MIRLPGPATNAARRMQRWSSRLTLSLRTHTGDHRPPRPLIQRLRSYRRFWAPQQDRVKISAWQWPHYCPSYCLARSPFLPTMSTAIRRSSVSKYHSLRRRQSPAQSRRASRRSTSLNRNRRARPKARRMRNRPSWSGPSASAGAPGLNTSRFLRFRNARRPPRNHRNRIPCRRRLCARRTRPRALTNSWRDALTTQSSNACYAISVCELPTARAAGGAYPSVRAGG